MRKEEEELSQGHKVVLFIGYTLGIYVCFLIGAVFEERIYKIPFARNGSSTHKDIFTDKLTPMMIVAGLSCFFGFLAAKNQEITFNIPISKLAKVAISDVLIHICIITALLRTNFTTMIVINSCSIVSVIFVGAFCSGVKYDRGGEEGEEEGAVRQVRNQKIGPQKLWMSFVVCIGIILFSISNGPEKEEAQRQAPGGTVVTAFLYGLALILQGFRPDFASQIKHEYRPSPLFLYFSIQGIIFTLVLAINLLTWNISYFVTFILTHNGLMVDLSIWAVLHALGGIFCYKLMSIFRQHILPLVINTRKCMTVVVNVLWYGHHLVLMQWLGVILVFGGIMMEVVANYNLANKILPNKNIKNRQGQNYNKIVPKDEEVNVGYHSHPEYITQGVQGI